ncbi:MAG: type VII toxin-antitoxin system HepT family RNase toxin [Pseudonocardia sp.]
MQSLLGDLAGLGEFDEARLETDRVPTLAAERILTLVVDLAVSVNSHVSAVRLKQTPADYKESFKLAARAGVITDELARSLAPSTSTRNVLVHAYLDIDYAEIAIAIPLALEQYREYVRQVATWLRDVAEQPG